MHRSREQVEPPMPNQLVDFSVRARPQNAMGGLACRRSRSEVLPYTVGHQVCQDDDFRRRLVEVTAPQIGAIRTADQMYGDSNPVRAAEKVRIDHRVYP